MSTFESTNAYSEFANVVKNERRFIFDGKAGDFLAAVRATSKSSVSGKQIQKSNQVNL